MPHSWEELGIDTHNKTSGELKTTCPHCSATRKKKHYPCLSINLDKAVWHCWHCEWSGSLQHGDDLPPRKPQRSYTRPTYRATALPQRALSWFGSRGIPEAVLARNRISYGPVYMPQVEQEVTAIQFPYFRDGDVINVKYRDGQKHFRMVGGGERLLYGLDDVVAPTVVIVEGEMDKLAVEVAGVVSCVSVPDGAPSVNTKNYASKFDYLVSAETVLAPCTKILLAVDNDAPGETLAQELARRLGPERCWRVEWSAGCKDANEVLMTYGASTLAECLDQATPWPVRGIVDMAQLASAVWHMYANGLQRGCSPGWITLARHYTVRPGELTIVTGIPGDGKSTWLSALALNVARTESWRFTIFSPENVPLERYAALLVQQHTGHAFDGINGLMPEAELAWALEWLGEHVSFLLPDDAAPTIPFLLELARVQVLRQGIRGLILDPWNECDHSRPAGQTETEYISHTLSLLRRFARMHGVHVWVVAHPTKLTKPPNGTYAPPTPYDISGCYAADTDVLTDHGWKTHDKIGSDDRVACFDLKKHALIYHHPLSTWEYDYMGEMIHLSSPSFDALVTPNHRMVVSQSWREHNPMKGTGRGRPMKYQDAWGFVEAQQLASSLVMPFASRLQDDTADIPTIEGYDADDFLRLLGWWIGEGCLQKGGVSLCQAVGPVQRAMEACLKRLGFVYRSRITQYKAEELPMWTGRIYARKHPGLAGLVASLCGEGAPHKHMPGLVWGLSLRQKQLFLDALLDGDGHRPPARPGTASYTTTSKQLADEVQRLAIELGYPSSIACSWRGLAHHLVRYQINLGRQERQRIGIRMDRHKAIELYHGKVYCLTVPTGAYVTRRNGKMIIAGNSAHWYNKADNCLTVWRDREAGVRRVEIHVSKVRFREIGSPGMVELAYDPLTGRYTDLDLPALSPAQEAHAWHH